jgi:ABC-type dipeptide/oligopeptide/nickel transport system permease component
MARFILRRCLQALPTLFIISIVVFTLMRLAR